MAHLTTVSRKHPFNCTNHRVLVLAVQGQVSLGIVTGLILHELVVAREVLVVGLQRCSWAWCADRMVIATLAEDIETVETIQCTIQ